MFSWWAFFMGHPDKKNRGQAIRSYIPSPARRENGKRFSTRANAQGIYHCYPYRKKKLKKY